MFTFYVYIVKNDMGISQGTFFVNCYLKSIVFRYRLDTLFLIHENAAFALHFLLPQQKKHNTTKKVMNFFVDYQLYIMLSDKSLYSWCYVLNSILHVYQRSRRVNVIETSLSLALKLGSGYTSLTLGSDRLIMIMRNH